MSPLNFLICSERSGSNFITSLLNGHPHISAPPPTHLFRLFALNAHRYDPLSDDRNWENFQSDFREAFEAMPGQWISTFPEEALKFDRSNRSIATALERIYAAERNFDKANISFVKENQTYRFTDFLIHHWPKAKFVFQVRDPRDMALSLFKTKNMSGGIIEATDKWIADQTASLYSLKSLPQGSVIQVKYEDLLDDPLQLCEKLCHHLDLKPDPGMLDFHKSPRTIANAKRTGAWSNLDKGVLKNNQKKFLTELTPNEIKYIEIKCGALMEKFGYDRVLTDENRIGTNQDDSVEALAKKIRAPSKVVPETDSDAKMRMRRAKLISRVIAR